MQLVFVLGHPATTLSATQIPVGRPVTSQTLSRLLTGLPLPSFRPIMSLDPAYLFRRECLVLRLRNPIHNPQLQDQLPGSTRRRRLTLDRVPTCVTEIPLHDVARFGFWIFVHAEVLRACQRDGGLLNEQVGTVN